MQTYSEVQTRFQLFVCQLHCKNPDIVWKGGCECGHCKHIEKVHNYFENNFKCYFKHYLNAILANNNSF